MSSSSGSREKPSPGSGPVNFATPGRRLRHARLVKGYTLRQLADAADCSESMLSKLENSRLSPSLALLRRLAAVLGTTAADLLLQPPEGDADDGVVVFPAERLRKAADERDASDGGPLYDRVLPFERSGLLQVSILHLPAGSEQRRSLSHEGEEFLFVLEGRLDVIVAGRTHPVGPGDGIFFASVLDHRYANTGDAPVRALWVNTPPTM